VKRIVAMLILASALAARAGEVRLAWDPATTNTDGTPLTNLGGYEIVRGQASRVYSWTSNVGNVITARFVGLTEGQTYYWSGRAYNTDGEYSDLATEFVWTCPDITPPVIAPPGNRLLWTSGTTPVACPDLRIGLVVTDNVTPAAQIVLTQTPAPGTMLPVGTHTVTLTARDAAGNLGTATATVRVQKRRPGPMRGIREATP
jgi:hypothetical protein